MERKFCVVVVDMQDHYLNFLGGETRRNLINSQIVVLNFAKQNGLPAIFLEDDVYAPTISALERIPRNRPEIPEHRFARIRKHYWSGFVETNLDAQLIEWQISDIALMGLYSSRCVGETAEDALKRNYGVHTAKDLIVEPINSDYYDTIDEIWHDRTPFYYQNHTELLNSIEGMKILTHK